MYNYTFDGQREEKKPDVKLSLIEAQGTIILSGTIEPPHRDAGCWIIAEIDPIRFTVSLHVEGALKVGLKVVS